MDFFAIIYAQIMIIFQLFFAPVNEYTDSRYTLDLSDSQRPHVASVELTGADNADISNVYNINVLHSEVVGLFGCPVEVQADEFDGAVLTFRYDESKMYHVPAENLIVLHYDEEDYFYNEIRSLHNEEDNSISVQITEGGAYMLADKFEWYKAWGYDVDEFAHDTMYHDEAAGVEFEMLIPAEVDFDIIDSYPQETASGMTETPLIEGDTDEPFYINAVLREGEDIWQKEYTGWQELIFAPPEYQHIESEQLTLENGAQAMLYHWSIDEHQGLNAAASVFMNFKIDNDTFITVSFGISGNDNKEELTKLSEEYLRTFRWTSELPEEAFISAIDEDIN